MRCAAALLALGFAAGYSTAETPPWQELADRATAAQLNGFWAAAEQHIDQAWTVIKQTDAGDENFPAGVEMVVNHYNTQGLGIKSDLILREAETAIEHVP